MYSFHLNDFAYLLNDKIIRWVNKNRTEQSRHELTSKPNPEFIRALNLTEWTSRAGFRFSISISFYRIILQTHNTCFALLMIEIRHKSKSTNRFKQKTHKKSESQFSSKQTNHLQTYNKLKFWNTFPIWYVHILTRALWFAI